MDANRQSYGDPRSVSIRLFRGFHNLGYRVIADGSILDVLWPITPIMVSAWNVLALHPVTSEPLLFVSDNFVDETCKRRALPGVSPKDPDFHRPLLLSS